MNPTLKGDLSQGSPLECALGYVRRGWSIIPIANGTKKPPKRFRWKKYQKKLPTEQEIRCWLADRDDLGLAVICGRVSGGLVCRDYDDMAAYNAWARAHPDLAVTLHGCHAHGCRGHVEGL